MQEIVDYLKEKNKTISTMESCTGGFLASEITNIEGASNVIKFSAVTYSNEYKIKMGVDKNIIDKYTVYSIETAKDMSKKIVDFTNSDYGVGITGNLKKSSDYERIVYISIYDKEKDNYYESTITVDKNKRIDNKKEVIDKIIEMFKDKIIKKLDK